MPLFKVSWPAPPRPNRPATYLMDLNDWTTPAQVKQLLLEQGYPMPDRVELCGSSSPAPRSRREGHE